MTEHAPLAGARAAAVRALGDSIVNYRSTLLPGADSAEHPAGASDGSR